MPGTPPQVIWMVDWLGDTFASVTSKYAMTGSDAVTVEDSGPSLTTTA